MDKLIEVLKHWVQVNLNSLKTGKSPHVSYIINTIVSHPTSRSVVQNLSGYEIVQLGYIIFFMFEGKTMEEAKKMAEIIHMVIETEIKNIRPEQETCDDCDGNGDIECYECDGEGEVECSYCDGEGEFEGSDGEMDTCGVCDGTGKESCSECYGDTTITCHECGGDGEIETGYDYVEYEETYWFFTSDELYKTYQAKLDGDIQNKDFYEESDEHSGDLWLYRSLSDGMRFDDFDDLPDDVEEGDSLITTLDEDVPDNIKRNMSIQKYGNSGRDYRIV